MKKYLVVIALLLSSTSAFAASAFWTGRQEQVQTVTYQWAEQILQERQAAIEQIRHDETLAAASLANLIAFDAKTWAIIAAIIAAIAIYIAK